MMNIKIRDASPNDFDKILFINEKLVHFLAPLSKEKLIHMNEQTSMHKVVDFGNEVVAFLLVFREGADYDSVNYAWFSSHFEKFLYVDRVVVLEESQGMNIGKLLYEEVFKYAKDNEVEVVTAEIDIMPPNPVSLKFHQSFGFKEVSTQFVAGGKKQVSLQVAKIL